MHHGEGPTAKGRLHTLLDAAPSPLKSSSIQGWKLKPGEFGMLKKHTLPWEHREAGTGNLELQRVSHQVTVCNPEGSCSAWKGQQDAWGLAALPMGTASPLLPSTQQAPCQLPQPLCGPRQVCFPSLAKKTRLALLCVC